MMIKYIKVHGDTVNFSRTQPEYIIVVGVHIYYYKKKIVVSYFKKMRRDAWLVNISSCLYIFIFSKPNQIYKYIPHTKWSNPNECYTLCYYYWIICACY